MDLGEPLLNAAVVPGRIGIFRITAFIREVYVKFDSKVVPCDGFYVVYERVGLPAYPVCRI